MRSYIVTIILSLMVSTPAYAWNQFETIDEARQRHSAERYDTYRDNGYRAPLGGYREKLGDTAPFGTESPGYSSPKSYGIGSPYGSGEGGLKRYTDRW